MTARRLAEKISGESGVPMSALFGRERDRKSSAARRELMFRLYEPPFEWSLPRIGKYLKRHHTSVLWNFRKARAARSS